MIFCGDIALPFDGKISINNIPQSLLDQQWIGNLEGSLVQCDDEKRNYLLKQHIVFNDKQAIETLCKSIPFVAFNIANNHILDAAPIAETLSNLQNIDKRYVGAGHNIKEAELGLVIGDYVLLSFGWDAINCIYAAQDAAGVNPYEKEHLFSLFQKTSREHSTKKIICLFHWNYELELYPQPLDREIAQKLIDLGAFAIIGCHAHRVQTIEYYKNRPIVYGMGNFAFPHSVYMNGKLKFPSFTSTEYIVELNEDCFKVHELHFDTKSNIVRYIGEIGIIENHFTGMNNDDYEKWFKRHRFQKKALPIIRYADSKFIHFCKIKWIVARNQVTKRLANYKKVNNLIKTFLSKVYD